MNTPNNPFSPEAIAILIQSLDIMAKGMLSIFIFMFLFYLLIKSLDKVFNKKQAEKKD